MSRPDPDLDDVEELTPADRLLLESPPKDLSEEQRRARRRLQNRLAASNSRSRRKTQLSSLTETTNELESRLVNSEQTVRLLRAQCNELLCLLHRAGNAFIHSEQNTPNYPLKKSQLYNPNEEPFAPSTVIRLSKIGIRPELTAGIKFTSPNSIPVTTTVTVEIGGPKRHSMAHLASISAAGGAGGAKSPPQRRTGGKNAPQLGIVDDSDVSQITSEDESEYDDSQDDDAPFVVASNQSTRLQPSSSSSSRQNLSTLAQKNTPSTQPRDATKRRADEVIRDDDGQQDMMEGGVNSAQNSLNNVGGAQNGPKRHKSTLLDQLASSSIQLQQNDGGLSPSDGNEQDQSLLTALLSILLNNNNKQQFKGSQNQSSQQNGQNFQNQQNNGSNTQPNASSSIPNGNVDGYGHVSPQYTALGVGSNDATATLTALRKNIVVNQQQQNNQNFQNQPNQNNQNFQNQPSQNNNNTYHAHQQHQPSSNNNNQHIISNQHHANQPQQHPSPSHSPFVPLNTNNISHLNTNALFPQQKQQERLQYPQYQSHSSFNSANNHNQQQNNNNHNSPSPNPSSSHQSSSSFGPQTATILTAVLERQKRAGHHPTGPMSTTSIPINQINPINKSYPFLLTQNTIQIQRQQLLQMQLQQQQQHQ